MKLQLLSAHAGLSDSSRDQNHSRGSVVLTRVVQKHFSFSPSETVLIVNFLKVCRFSLKSSNQSRAAVRLLFSHFFVFCSFPGKTIKCKLTVGD